MLEVDGIGHAVNRWRDLHQSKSHPKIHRQRDSHNRAGVEGNHARSVAPCSVHAFFSQGPAYAATSGGGIDDEHANDRPRPIEVSCFWSSGRDIGDGSDYPFVTLSSDYLSGVGKHGHSSDRGRHRGPVGILQPKLIEGGEGKLIDLGGIAVSKSSQCVAEHRERGGLPHPCWVNTNQSISSVTASSWLVASPGVRSAAIPSWKSTADSRAKNESARRADFSMKLGQSVAVTCVTT